MTLANDLGWLVHPALRNLTGVIPLSGFSGATVVLVPAHGYKFVRKAANLPEANDGLRDQALRQRILADLLEDCAAVPRVLDMGESDGLFHFDMEFTPSRDAVNFLANGSFDTVAAFSDRVERLMERLSQAPAVCTGPAPLLPQMALLTDKLAQIVGRTGGHYAEDIAGLEQALARIDQLIPNPRVTATHGDLTFENILVDRNGGLWLIDTIRSPFDHYWVDWAKLFQDCEGLWHMHRGRPLARGVTWWLRQRFHAAATRMDPIWPARHYLLLGLTFARILPYARTPEDRRFVAGRVRDCGVAALAMIGET